MAISEEGNLDLNDTTFNKGLAMFMSSIGTPTLPTDPPVLEKEVIITGKPMLSKAVRKWGQYDPYNIYCPVNKVTNTHYKTGDMPVIMGQIMSFYRHPSNYQTTTFNWDDMVLGKDNDGVAKLFYLLGLESNLDINYEMGSFCEMTNITRAFYYFKYYNNRSIVIN